MIFKNYDTSFFFKYCTVGIYQKQAIMPVFYKIYPLHIQILSVKAPPLLKWGMIIIKDCKPKLQNWILV